MPIRMLLRRTLAALWVLACVWLLIRTFLLRSAPPRVFGDAVELELVLLLGLTAPLSGVLILSFRWLPFTKWPFAGNDPRTILAIWFFFFASGCLQWFVIVPWIVHKWFDLYDYAVEKGRRQFGKHV